MSYYFKIIGKFKYYHFSLIFRSNISQFISITWMSSLGRLSNLVNKKILNKI